MAWVIQTDRSHFAYGAGSWSDYYWNSAYNPGATFNLCMPNCTTYAYGRVMENGYPAPVTQFRNADNWHLYVNTSGGWSLLSYSQGMQLYAGDILEWSAQHVAVVEESGTNPRITGSWYTSRSVSQVGGDTLAHVSSYFIANNPHRFWHIQSMTTENSQAGGGQYPNYVLRYTGSGPTPPTPSETLQIEISPSSYTKTMSSSDDYVDFTFNITITGIPGGETVSGGNTYPDLTRVQNTGWSYTDYTVGGIVYRYASKTQTLRYTREHSYAYSTTKYMYFNISKSTGTINEATPMYITVRARMTRAGIYAYITKRKRRGRINVI